MGTRPYAILFLPLLVVTVLLLVSFLLPSTPPENATIRHHIPDGTILSYEVRSMVEQERIRGETHDRSRTEAETLILLGYYAHKKRRKVAIMFRQQSSKLLKFLRNGRDITDTLAGTEKETIPPEFFFLDRSEKAAPHIPISTINTGNIILALQCRTPPLGEIRTDKPVRSEQDFGELETVHEWRLKNRVKKDGKELALFSLRTIFKSKDGEKIGILEANLSVETKTSIIEEEKGELILNIEEESFADEPEKVIYRRKYSIRLLKKERRDSEKLAEQMREVQKSYTAQAEDKPLGVLEHLRKAIESFQESPFTPFIASRLDAALKRVRELYEELLSEELEKRLKKLLTCPHCGKVHGPDEDEHEEK